MAESQIPWSAIQKKAKKPLDNLQRTMKKAASNFGKYPKDPFQRQEFKNRVHEAAFSWARKFIDIHDRALAGAGNGTSDPTARLAWHSELSDLLEALIMRHVEAAFEFGADDHAWLKFGELIRSDEVDAAQAKALAIEQIRTDLRKHVPRHEAGDVTSRSQVSSQLGSTIATNLGVVSQDVKGISKPGPKPKPRTQVIQEILRKQPDLPARNVCRLLDTKFGAYPEKYPTIAKPRFGEKQYQSWQDAYSDKGATSLIDSLISRNRRK